MWSNSESGYCANSESGYLSWQSVDNINVDVCNTVKSTKYTCININKESDMAVFGIVNPNKNDEKVYLN